MLALVQSKVRTSTDYDIDFLWRFVPIRQLMRRVGAIVQGRPTALNAHPQRVVLRGRQQLGGRRRHIMRGIDCAIGEVFFRGVPGFAGRRLLEAVFVSGRLDCSSHGVVLDGLPNVRREE